MNPTLDDLNQDDMPGQDPDGGPEPQPTDDFLAEVKELIAESEPPQEPQAAEAEDETETEDEDEAAPEPLSTLARIRRRLVQVAILAGFLLIMFIGLVILFYPQISNYVNTKNASRVIDAYAQSILDLSEADYAAIMEDAAQYNAKLAGTGATVYDAFSQEDAGIDRNSDYWQLLNVAGDGVMGYVVIEELDIRLPLYHGVSEVVLARGVGHIQGSSLPVGGETTHAVVSAHTGLPSAKLFTGVDTMAEGDTFDLYILNEVLTYEIDQILVVLPHEIDALGIERGSDYVTLVTCTPYGINSHRLLIRGHRIETPPEKLGVATAEQPKPEADVEEAGPGWLERTTDSIVAFLAGAVERGAEAIVAVAEWGLDIFDVEY